MGTENHRDVEERLKHINETGGLPSIIDLSEEDIEALRTPTPEEGERISVVNSILTGTVNYDSSEIRAYCDAARDFARLAGVSEEKLARAQGPIIRDEVGDDPYMHINDRSNGISEGRIYATRLAFEVAGALEQSP